MCRLQGNRNKQYVSVGSRAVAWMIPRWRRSCWRGHSFNVFLFFFLSDSIRKWTSEWNTEILSMDTFDRFFPTLGGELFWKGTRWGFCERRRDEFRKDVLISGRRKSAHASESSYRVLRSCLDAHCSRLLEVPKDSGASKCNEQSSSRSYLGGGSACYKDARADERLEHQFLSSWPRERRNPSMSIWSTGAAGFRRSFRVLCPYETTIEENTWRRFR